MVKKGLRDMIGVHQVAPCGGIRLRLIRVPQRRPLVAAELPPSALAVRPLEPAHPSDHRMAIASGPRGMPPAVPLLPDLDHMELQGRIRHHHVADHRPAVRLPRQGLVVPLVDSDPSMQRPRVIRPRGGPPCTF